MAVLKQALHLAHRANTGSEIEEVEFAKGEEIEILQEWDSQYLCRNREGLLFNIRKDLVDPC